MRRFDSRPDPAKLAARMKRDRVVGELHDVVAVAKGLHNPQSTYEEVVVGVFDGDQLIKAYRATRAGLVTATNLDSRVNYHSWSRA